MLKKMVYKGVFLKEDVEEIARNIKDTEKVKNILGSINPAYYDEIYKKLKPKVGEKRLLMQRDFRRNEKVYYHHFFNMDIDAVVKNIDNKDVLKKIIPLVHPEYRLSLYSEVLNELPKEKAKKYGGYTDYVESKNDLSFFYEDLVSKETKESEETDKLKKQIENLEKEIENLKKQNEKNKDKTEEFGEKIFS